MMRNTDIFNSTEQDTKARLQLLYGNALGGLFITLLCMAVLCFGFETPEHQSNKTLIFSLLVCSHIIRIIDNLYTVQQFKKSDFKAKPVIWRLSAGVLVNSVIWASYSFLFVPTMDGIEITVSAIILSALAGGAITILAASTRLSVLYMSSLILPYAVMGFFSEFEYFHYISFLGFSFWAVMMVSSKQAGKFVSETLDLKNKNTSLIDLMDLEKKEVERVNIQLLTVNEQLDRYNVSLESEVNKRTEEIYRLSNLDPLTSLMNRSAFLHELKAITRRPESLQQQFALLFIDLDGFKDVNDGFGHKTGDSVLSEIGMRLQEQLLLLNLDDAQNNLLCRWGGDEFLLFMPYNSDSLIDTLSTSIQRSIAEIIKVSSNNIVLGASIGIAKFPHDSDDPHQLIQYADISMYCHKKLGEGDAIAFSPTLFEEFQYDQIIRDGLKHALANKEFSLAYQPIVDVQTNSLWAIEALLRWQHKEQFISPAEFIPIAEKSGRINQIGAWVLNKACEDAAKWDFPTKPAVSVNVSSIQLLDAGFIQVIVEALKNSGLPAQRLHLEITESVMLENGELAQSQLKKIADLGIHISIDDFGTGFSSLNQLQTMSFDIIKIDRSFLQDLNKRDKTIISATKLIADEFDACAVAEGIETETELEVLKGLGIRYIQGYLIARPMPDSELDNWVAHYQSRLD